MELADARRRAKLTQGGLADLAGIARSTVIKIEKGQVPRPDTAARLQHALETSLRVGRLELVFPHSSSAAAPENGTESSPPPQSATRAADEDAIVRRLEDETWEITLDAFNWFAGSEDDERSSGLFWGSLREFILPKKPGTMFYAPSVHVTAVIHVASLSPAIAARLGEGDEAWVHGVNALGLLIASNIFEAAPDEPSWGSITLLPWNVILGISNEHYVAAGARRYPREQAAAVAAPESPPP
jgi:transcriptional regulator with XRE-family HTH domain